MRGQRDLKSMKKGVNWNENQDENSYKILMPFSHWKKIKLRQRYNEIICKNRQQVQ